MPVPNEKKGPEPVPDSGLVWESGIFGVTPQWTREPATEAIEHVVRKTLGLHPHDSCTVFSYASGAFNKLFSVVLSKRKLLMRVTLPVYPHVKTRGEVVALQWVRSHAPSIAVPEVVAYDDTSKNEIGFEWILMTVMPGTPLYRRWRTMTMEQKKTLVVHLATFQAELFCHGEPGRMFRGIGTLTRRQSRIVPPPLEGSDASLGTALPHKMLYDLLGSDMHGDKPGVIRALLRKRRRPRPGQLVLQNFFMGKRLAYKVPRGPFERSYDWLSAELSLIEQAQQDAMDHTEDEDDREDAREILGLVKRLRGILRDIFPPATGTERTVLYHDDLNMHNILVDGDGRISAIVDWECVSAMPLWFAIRPPKFLENEVRETEPKRGEYANAKEGEAGADPELDNEGKAELYWDHLMEYETTQLRKEYNAQLTKLCKDWPPPDSSLKVSFYQEMQKCGCGIFLKGVRDWLDKAEAHIRKVQKTPKPGKRVL